MVTISTNSHARETGEILLNFRCLSPNLTTLYLM